MTPDEVMLKKKDVREKTIEEKLYPPVDPNTDWSGAMIKKSPFDFLKKLPKVKPFISLNDVDEMGYKKSDKLIRSITIGIKGEF